MYPNWALKAPKTKTSAGTRVWNDLEGQKPVAVVNTALRAPYHNDFGKQLAANLT